MGKANRNRNAGHQWERDICTILNKYTGLLPIVGSARKLSKFYDDNGVDIVTENMREMDDMILAIQAKTTTTTISYPKLLSHIRDRLSSPLGKDLIPIVFHRQTEPKGTRFYERDRFACLYLDDFLSVFTSMISYKKGYELLNKYFDSIPEEDKKSVGEELEKIGLL
jgi:hypothetical protein